MKKGCAIDLGYMGLFIADALASQEFQTHGTERKRTSS